MFIEGGLIWIAKQFRDSDLPYVVLKGPATAECSTRPTSVPFRDLDVLVPGEFFDHARILMGAAAAPGTTPKRDRGSTGGFTKGASFRMPNGLAIDLHRTFVLGPYGFLVDLTGVFDRSRTVAFGTEEIAVLAADDALLHVSTLRLETGRPRLTPNVMWRNSLRPKAWTHTSVLDRAREWKVEAVVARAVRLANETLAVPMPAALLDWARTYRFKRWERWALSLYDEGRTYRRQVADRGRSVRPGLREENLPMRAAWRFHRSTISKIGRADIRGGWRPPLGVFADWREAHVASIHRHGSMPRQPPMDLPASLAFHGHVTNEVSWRPASSLCGFRHTSVHDRAFIPDVSAEGMTCR